MGAETVAVPVAWLYATPPGNDEESGRFGSVELNTIGPNGHAGTPSKSGPVAWIRNVIEPFSVTTPVVGSTLPVNALSARVDATNVSSSKSAFANGKSAKCRLFCGIVKFPAPSTVPAAGDVSVIPASVWASGGANVVVMPTEMLPGLVTNAPART